jgi:hypothetical protein
LSPQSEIAKKRAGREEEANPTKTPKQSIEEQQSAVAKPSLQAPSNTQKPITQPNLPQAIIGQEQSTQPLLPKILEQQKDVATQVGVIVPTSSTVTQSTSLATRFLLGLQDAGKYAGQITNRLVNKATRQVNLMQGLSPQEQFLLPANLDTYSFALGWNGLTPEGSNQFTFTVEKSEIPRGEVGRYVSGTDKKIIGALYHYVITVNQNLTAPCDYSLQIISSFAPITIAEIKSIAIVEINRTTPITKDQYDQITKNVVAIDHEAQDNRESLKNIRRTEEYGPRLRKIKLHNMLVTIVNRMTEEKTLADYIKTPEGVSYKIILFEVFKGQEQLNLYKEQAEKKKEKMSFLTFLSKTISQPTSYQENLSRYHSKAGAGWMQQVKKMDVTSISDRTLEIAGNTYLLSILFDNITNANLGDHYEIYLMPDDNCLVDLFISIVALFGENRAGIDFIAIKLTPGVSYTRKLKSEEPLPRIIVSLKPTSNKTEAEDVIQRIRTVIATNKYTGIKTKPRYSTKIIDPLADFVYAAHGSIAYKDTTKGADEYKAHMPYKNKDDQLFKESTTSFFDTIIEGAQKAKNYTDTIKFWKWKWRK